jgi:hypothetical protein
MSRGTSRSLVASGWRMRRLGGRARGHRARRGAGACRRRRRRRRRRLLQGGSCRSRCLTSTPRAGVGRRPPASTDSGRTRTSCDGDPGAAGASVAPRGCGSSAACRAGCGRSLHPSMRRRRWRWARVSAAPAAVAGALPAPMRDPSRPGWQARWQRARAPRHPSRRVPAARQTWCTDHTGGGGCARAAALLQTRPRSAGKAPPWLQPSLWRVGGVRPLHHRRRRRRRHRRRPGHHPRARRRETPGAGKRAAGAGVGGGAAAARSLV